MIISITIHGALEIQLNSFSSQNDTRSRALLGFSRLAGEEGGAGEELISFPRPCGESGSELGSRHWHLAPGPRVLGTRLRSPLWAEILDAIALFAQINTRGCGRTNVGHIRLFSSFSWLFL